MHGEALLTISCISHFLQQALPGGRRFCCILYCDALLDRHCDERSAVRDLSVAEVARGTGGREGGSLVESNPPAISAAEVDSKEQWALFEGKRSEQKPPPGCDTSVLASNPGVRVSGLV